MDRRDNTDIITAVQEAVRSTVNGKIDKLTSTLELHIEEDRKWKEKVSPILDSIPELKGVGVGVKWFSTFSRGIKSLSGVVLAIGAVIGGFIAFIKFVLQ